MYDDILVVDMLFKIDGLVQGVSVSPSLGCLEETI